MWFSVICEWTIWIMPVRKTFWAKCEVKEYIILSHYTHHEKRQKENKFPARWFCYASLLQEHYSCNYTKSLVIVVFTCFFFVIFFFVFISIADFLSEDWCGRSGRLIHLLFYVCWMCSLEMFAASIIHGRIISIK